MARSNNRAPGIDGVTFQAIEEDGGVEYLLGQIRTELAEKWRQNLVQAKAVEHQCADTLPGTRATSLVTRLVLMHGVLNRVFRTPNTFV